MPDELARPSATEGGSVAEEIGPPSAFFLEHAERLRASAGIGRTLDLACGRGRHAFAAADLGLDVLALDRNAEVLDRLAALAAARPTDRPGRIETLRVDLEAPDATSPGAAEGTALRPARFGAVLVFRYLHRPLLPWIESLVAPGGILLYETFTTAQRELGWGPRRDDFLLRPGELPTLVGELEIEVHEEGPSHDEPPAMTARLLARRRR